jgi:hypothetical protein
MLEQLAQALVLPIFMVLIIGLVSTLIGEEVEALAGDVLTAPSLGFWSARGVDAELISARVGRVIEIPAWVNEVVEILAWIGAGVKIQKRSQDPNAGQPMAEGSSNQRRSASVEESGSLHGSAIGRGVKIPM